MANSQDVDFALDVVSIAFAPDEVAYLDMQGAFPLSFERKLRDKIKELKDENIKVKDNSNKLTASNAKTKKLIDDVMVHTEKVLNLMIPEPKKSSNFANVVLAAKAATTTLKKQLTNLNKSTSNSKKVMTAVGANIKRLHADFGVFLEQAKKAADESEMDKILTELDDLESKINSWEMTNKMIKATNSLKDSVIQYTMKRERYMISDIPIIPHHDEVTSDEDDKHVSPEFAVSQVVILFVIGILITPVGDKLYTGYNEYNDLLRKKAYLIKKIADKNSVVAIARIATDKSKQIFTSIDQQYLNSIEYFEHYLKANLDILKSLTGIQSLLKRKPTPTVEEWNNEKKLLDKRRALLKDLFDNMYFLYIKRNAYIEKT
ncbi:hypothetical protein [Photorhabdus khanii]|uniref:Uncharacterized protein n=1 Tax=Photorhabdus khanii subsp. guanajuatensis TaxID=2100166 RepID=A0A4R4IPM2_9GAMM|nr:hypothetical protein [Photorhabdus khanii]TDB42587.1 hypothetical protein C5467_23810 [Photorhabdus khanii subsp. guanajuatensis]